MAVASAVLTSAAQALGGTNSSNPATSNPASAGQIFVNEMAPYAQGGSMQPGSAGNPNPTPPQSPSIVDAVSSGPTAAQIAAQNQIGNLQTADMNGINSSIGANAGDLNDLLRGSNGFITSDTAAQNTINANAVQNELAKDQGYQGVNDMVHNGIQGGGVQIDDAGGGTSSAAGQLAQDYGIVGRQAASQVGNQYAQGQNSINNQQTALGLSETGQQVDYTKSKNDAINSIVNSATSTLQYLDLMAQNAGVTDLPNIINQIATVKAQATAALSAYDGDLSANTPAPTSQADNQAKAQGLFASGTAPQSAFNFTTTAPATLAPGPSPSSLPIFLAPKNNNQQSVEP